MRIDMPRDWEVVHAPTTEPESEPQLVVLDEDFITGHVVVFTDGACVHNQRECLRRAGLGAWWADDHENNISEPLPGIAQTNQRAELFAVIRALQIEHRPLHVKTDSKYVLDGCLCHRFAWAALGWRKVKNADLWKQLHALLEDRNCSFTKASLLGGPFGERRQLEFLFTRTK